MQTTAYSAELGLQPTGVTGRLRVERGGRARDMGGPWRQPLILDPEQLDAIA